LTVNEQLEVKPIDVEALGKALYAVADLGFTVRKADRPGVFLIDGVPFTPEQLIEAWPGLVIGIDAVLRSGYMRRCKPIRLHGWTIKKRRLRMTRAERAVLLTVARIMRARLKDKSEGVILDPNAVQDFNDLDEVLQRLDAEKSAPINQPSAFA